MQKEKSCHFVNLLKMIKLGIPLAAAILAPLQLYSLTGFEKYNIVYDDIPIDDEVFEWGEDDDDWDSWDNLEGWDKESENEDNDKVIFSKSLNHSCKVDDAPIDNLLRHYNETSEEISERHLYLEPNPIVNNSVNIITGLYVDREVDFVIPGAEPLILKRHYVSCDTDARGPLGKGWNRNYFGIIERSRKDNDKKNCHRAIVFESSGCLHYGSKKRYNFKMLQDTYKNGVTNCGESLKGAQTNITNNTLECIREDKTCLFKKSSGEKMLFKPFKHRYFWRLAEEKKPNGNIIQYTYLKGGNLGELVACNRHGTPLSKLTFNYSKKKRESFISIACNNKEKASYRLKKMKGIKTKKGMYLVEAIREKKPRITYEYENNHQKAKTPKITMKKKPDGRFQTIAYYHKGSNWLGHDCVKIKHHKSPRAGRVMQQCAPVGHDSKSIITHSYFYDDVKIDKPGSARVFDAYNHLINYQWSDSQRLTAVTRFTGVKEYKFYSREKFFWGNKGCDECTRLQACCYETNDGIQFARTFTYDQFGNIIADELYGNLTGNNPEPCLLSPSGKVLSSRCEKYGKYYTYTNDERHLVATETEGDVTHAFEYDKDSNLLIAKLSSFHGKIFKREFFAYDENGILIQSSIDDGTTSRRRSMQGVTEKHIRYIQPRKQMPIGLPEIVKEKVLDLSNNHEVLSKKTVYHYTEDGELVAQEIYDGDNNLQHTLQWEYDERGNCVKETNAEGQIIARHYDANGNIICEKGINFSSHKEFVYDHSNRLIRIDEANGDGEKLSESYSYDYLGLKKSFTDTYGSITHYEYDDFGRLVKTFGNNPKHPWISTEYNCFNAPIRTIDAEGNITLSETNIRGKPTNIQHSDGSLEQFSYNLDGTTSKHIHKNGSYTLYQYDFLKRVTEKSSYNAKGKLLESIKYNYNIFHLISETDVKGVKTSYSYDARGHLIKKSRKKNTKHHE